MKVYIISLRHQICLECKYSNSNAQFCTKWKGDGLFQEYRTESNAKCPLGKWENLDLTTYRCPHRTCANCSEPSSCRISGAACEFGPGTYDKCKLWQEIAKANNRPVVENSIRNPQNDQCEAKIAAICEGCDVEYCAWRNRTACAKRRILSEKKPQMITTACKRNKWGIDDLK